MEVSQVDDLQQYIFSAPPAPERSPYHAGSDLQPPGGEQPVIRDSVADSVEEGIRRAELLLARDLTGGNAKTASPPVPVSAGRRKQILRGLANERAELRGFASEREVKLTAPSPHDSSQVPPGAPDVAARQYLGAGSAPPYVPPRAGMSSTRAPVPSAALHSTATEMVNDAITKALSVHRKAIGADATPGAAGQSLINLVGGATTGVTSRYTATPGSATVAPTPAQPAISATNRYKSTAERNKLVESMLAERAAKKQGNAATTPATSVAHQQHQHQHQHQHRFVAGGLASPAPSQASWGPPPSRGRLSRPGDSQYLPSAAESGGVAHHPIGGPVGPISAPAADAADDDDGHAEPLFDFDRDCDADSIDGTKPGAGTPPPPAAPAAGPGRSSHGASRSRGGSADNVGGGGGAAGAAGRLSALGGAAPPPRGSTRGRAHGQNNSSAGTKPQRRQTAAQRAASRQAKARLFQRRSLEELKRKREERELKECTFKPAIKPYKGSRRRRAATREQRLEELSKSQKRKYDEREKLRAHRQQEAVKECTFAPKINPQSRVVARGRRGGDVGERLHQQAQQRARQRAQLKEESEAQAAADFPFRPVINADSHRILDLSRYRPIHERVGDLQRTKNEHLLRMRLANQAENPDLTFKPQICATSEKLAEQRHQEDGEAGKSVTERLSREARARQRARAMRHQAWEAKLAADYKFKPTINPKSEALVSEMPEYQRDFVTRQELLRQEQERNFDAVIERVELETNQCTFKPSIGNANEVLVHTRPSRLGENEADVVERLSTRDRQRIQQLRRDMENEYYAQFNFKPKLNERSKRIGVPVSVEEQTERRREARERAAAEVMAKRMAECTFQPKTTKTPESVRRYREEEGGGAQRFQLDIRDHPEQITEKIAAYERRKNKKLAKARHEQQYAEQDACPFKPKTNPPRKGPPANKAVIVRGLGKFLERKEKADRIDQEKKQREEAAFQVRGVPSTVPTIPKPFNLASTDAHSAARARRAAREKEERLAQQCTFRPQTMESEKRQLIQRLLHEEEAAAAAATAAGQPHRRV